MSTLPISYKDDLWLNILRFLLCVKKLINVFNRSNSCKETMSQKIFGITLECQKPHKNIISYHNTTQTIVSGQKIRACIID